MRLNILPWILSVCSLAACTADTAAPPFVQDTEILEDEDAITLVDQTGKSWDITHAVKNYDFEPQLFRFGLGPRAILPINNPRMLSPGDPNYPDNDDNFLVMGTTLQGDSRAYPLNAMSLHEIANEKFDSQYVAVAY